MSLKVVFTIFIFAINFNAILCQLSCNYNTTSYGYTCELYIYNPNGLNNFGSIDGTHLPGYTDNNVECIIVTPGSISPNIPSAICLKFKYIYFMLLRSMGIQRVDDYSFISCNGMRHLDLTGNSISTVHEKAFIRNLNLFSIIFRGHNLSTLPENVFQYQQQLVSLAIASSVLQDLPTKIFWPLTGLEVLDLEYNRLQILRPEWFENLQNLEHLYLPGNFITDFPKNVFSHLTKLTLLYAHGNRLKMIHADSFGFLPNLKNIYIYSNLVDAIDENLIDYTGVTNIDMNGNICATGDIRDDSISRDYMRAVLRECFNNYERSTSGE